MNVVSGGVQQICIEDGLQIQDSRMLVFVDWLVGRPGRAELACLGRVQNLVES
ncbi:uncharacterized protein METZ01_LOCUS307042, partial [marine metagenome]